MNLTIVHGDITAFDGDAIVNAANPIMLGGGGVDGAIHRAAGPGLLEACKDVWADETKSALGGGMGGSKGVILSGVRCPTGHVVPTPAFDLPCKWVFHAAGPIWPGSMLSSGQHSVTEARKLLTRCFHRPAALALVMGLKSIAYPAISAGVYGCPMPECARIFMEWFAARPANPLEVTLVLFDEPQLELWRMTADKHKVPHA